MSTTSPVIVAIDDYPDNLVAVKAFVTDLFPGARVYTAQNGSEGIDLVRLKNPDVILLDIVMPGMDGFEVCRLLKQDPHLQHIPVIFLTALRDDRENRIRALEAGGEGFISKPFEEAEFTAQIRAMVKIKVANDRDIREKESLVALVARRTAELETELAERKAAEQELKEANLALTQNRSAMLNLLQDLKAEMQAKQKSETLLNTVVKNLDRVIFSTDDQGIFILSEGKGLSSLGLAGGQVVGQSVFSLYKNIPEVIAGMKSALAGKAWSGVIYVQDHFFDTTITPVFDEHQTVTGAVGIATEISGIVGDVSEPGDAQEGMQEGQRPIQRLLDLFRSSDSGISEPDLSRIIDIHEFQLLISDVHALIGLPVAILDMHGTVLVAEGWQEICTQFHRVNPETCKFCRESDTILTQGVVPGTSRLYRCKNNMWDYSTPIVVGGTHLGNLFIGQFLFDDEAVDYTFFREQAKRYGFEEDAYIRALDTVPRWNKKTVKTVMEFYTRLVHLVTQLSWSNLTLARTVTERDSLLASVQENERKFRDYINNAPNGIFIADENGRYLEVNPAASEITGYTEEELLRMQLQDMVPPESHEIAGNHFEQVMKEGKASGELLFRHKNGSLRYWSVDAVQLSPTRFIGFVQDITNRKLGENALSESQARLITLIQTIPDLIWLKDQDGVYLACNPMFERFFGAREEEIVGKTDYDFVDPDLADFFREHDQKAIALGRPISNEEWITFADNGHRALLDTIKTPMYDARGTFIGVLGIGRDITDRKRAEMELVSAQESLKEAHRLAHIGTWSWSMETDTVTWSEELYHIMGRDPSLPAPSYAEHPEIYTPPSWDRLSAAVERAVSTGEPYNLELELIHPDGSVRWTNEFGGVKRDEEGKIIGLHGTVQDITRQKLAELSLTASQALLNTTLDSIPDIIGIQNPDQTIVRYNRAGYEFLQTTQEEVQGRRCYELIGRTRPCENCATIKAIRSKKTEYSERYLPEQDIHLDCSSSPVLDKNGEITLLVEQLRNVTERKRSEEALHESNQKLRLLTSLTRHDILNQVCAVELLQDLALETSDPAKRNDYISNAQKATHQIEATIGFTREYESFGIVSSGWLRIHLMIASGTDELSCGDVKIENQISQDLEIYADPIIRKVFTTLMENAIRHGGDLSSIRFFGAPGGPSYIITCEDDGIGIPAAEKEVIFDHGYGKHTGIGLFLAREILSITGLSIRECGVEGKGARFEITVPAGRFRRTPHADLTSEP